MFEFRIDTAKLIKKPLPNKIKSFVMWIFDPTQICKTKLIKNVTSENLPQLV